ncbi:type II secretion system F family protein [Clostridium thermosuccinogenes]|uniref:type II secretion system F family protein n=1 Tax=Clostridium thermosuccinogenes TaxID=84032 RepID=UPI000CCC1DAA|nr:pilus assembly protein TadB [Pseudoclostridium thermosuccinogenes]
MGLFFNAKENNRDKPTANNALEDYDFYCMTAKEKMLWFMAAAVVIFSLSYIFYHSVVFSAILGLLALFYPRIRTRKIIEKRKNELNLQFKDLLYSISSSLSAGKSIEMAFRDALRDLEVLYPDPDTSIIKEVQYIIRKIDVNETVESALADLARRSHIEDIENFADVMQTCKRTGGNMIEVIKNASNIINDKIEIKQEISTMLAERKFEQKVLNAFPVLIVLFLTFSAEDYIAPIFNTWAGRLSMTVSVILLGAAYFISKKIMDIKV